MSDDAAPGNEVGASVPAGAISRELLIINKRGLHALSSMPRSTVGNARSSISIMAPGMATRTTS